MLRGKRLWLAALACSLALPLRADSQADESLPPMRIGTLMQIAPDHPVVSRVSGAYHRLGRQMVLETMPLARLKIEAAKGVLIDGNLAAAASLAEQVPELLLIPVPVYQLRLAVYTLPAQRAVRQWSDLQGLRLTYLEGMLSVQARLQHHGLAVSQSALTLSQALQYVEKGRVDAAVLPCDEAEYVLSQWPAHQVKRQLPLLEQITMYHYIHQKHQELVPALTGQLRQSSEVPSGTETLCTQ